MHNNASSEIDTVTPRPRVATPCYPSQRVPPRGRPQIPCPHHAPVKPSQAKSRSLRPPFGVRISGFFRISIARSCARPTFGFDFGLRASDFKFINPYQPKSNHRMNSRTHNRHFLPMSDPPCLWSNIRVYPCCQAEVRLRGKKFR